MTHGQRTRRSGDDQTKLIPAGGLASAGTAVDEAIGSHPDPVAADKIVRRGLPSMRRSGRMLTRCRPPARRRQAPPPPA